MSVVLVLGVLANMWLRRSPSDVGTRLLLGVYLVGLAVLVYFIGRHLWYQKFSGRVLLDVGAKDRAGWPVFLGLIGGIVLAGSVVEDFTQNDLNLIEATQLAFATSGCVFIVLTGMSRIRLTEQGLFAAPDLVRWESMVGFQWVADTDLQLMLNGRLSFQRSLSVPIPASQKAAVEQLLVQRGVGALS